MGFDFTGDNKLLAKEPGKTILRYGWSGWSWRGFGTNGICHIRGRCCNCTKAIRRRGFLCQRNVSEGTEVLPLCSQVHQLLWFHVSSSFFFPTCQPHDLFILLNLMWDAICLLLLVVTYITDYWPPEQRSLKFLKIQTIPASWQAMMVREYCFIMKAVSFQLDFFAFILSYDTWFHYCHYLCHSLAWTLWTCNYS